MKRRLLSFVIAVLLLFVLFGCSNTSDTNDFGNGAQITTDLSVTGSDVDLTITADQMNTIAVETLSCTNVDSNGDVAEVEVIGFDLLAYLEGQGVDLSTVTSMNLIASDGYQMAVPQETYAENGMYIAVALDSEYITTPRSCLPDQRAMYWVRDLVSIELVSGEASDDTTVSGVTQVKFFREISSGTNGETLDNRGYDVTAYSLNAFFQQYMDAVPTSPVTMKALDGFEKTETADVFLSCYVTYEAEEGLEDELPLYFSVTLSDGMRVKQLDTVVAGSEAVYFGSETSVSDLFATIGMEEADSYQFIASDGYVTEIPADAIQYGQIFADDEDGFIRTSFEGYDWGEAAGGGKVKYLTSIVANVSETESSSESNDSASANDATLLKCFVGDTKFTMTEADFLALPQITVTLTKTNSKGESTTGAYSGVHWTDIADFLDIDSDVSVTFVASDDYESAITSEILNDPDSLFALHQDGDYIESEGDGRVWFCASENFTANYWVKYITKVVVD